MANASRADAMRPPRQRLGRKLRQASWVNPKTGERSKRQFTLREASNRLSQYSDERTPLLPNGHGSYDVAEDDSEFSIAWDICRNQVLQAWHFLCSKNGQGILKCSLAYLIGSFATFIPAISGLFGHKLDSKHMVATCTVYFSPARTIGSMHEATVLAFIAFCYAGFLSFTSMGISMFFRSQNLLAVGHAIVLVLFVGGGLGGIAWIKQRLAHPLVNVATSLASLSCITVLIKEGSVQGGYFSTDRVSQVLLMVIFGVLISTAVNGLVFPRFARRNLTQEIERNTDLLGEMLICITRAFLLGRQANLHDEFYKALSKDHQESLSTLSKNLVEAKREQLLVGNERFYHVEARLVECLNGLAQDLGGLRSAAFAQFAFIDQVDNDDSERWVRSEDVSSPKVVSARPPPSNLGVISEVPDEIESQEGIETGSSRSQDQTQASSTSGDLSYTPSSTVPHTPLFMYDSESDLRERQDTLSVSITQGPGDMFIAFVSQLGPPIKSLVFTIKQILDVLPFKDPSAPPPWWNPWAARSHEVAVNEQFHSRLREAVDLYRQSRKEALSVLYQNRAVKAAMTARDGSKSSFGQRNPSVSSPNGMKTSTPAKVMFGRDPEEVLADIEEVSACCGHFSFSLLDFAEGILSYLDILEDLKTEMEANTHTWNWLLFWRRSDEEPRPMTRAATFQQHEEDNEASISIPISIRKADEIADRLKSNYGRPWYYTIYKALRFTRRDDIKFGIKVGIGAALYALPAFLEETRPFFVHWRGEWGLVSYMVVCVMTLGASTTTATQRFVGTCIGAALAIVAWVLSSHAGIANPWILGFFGWLVSLPCFYLIVAKDKGPMGRFILLTYNLGALYSYSLSIRDDDNDDDEGGIDPAIWEIVLHRVVSVIVGIIWGIIVSRVIWPLSARRKLRQGLCVLFLRMGLIWKRDPLASLLLGGPRTSYMDIREEAELHSFLANLKGLRKAAISEFELRGPFPDKPVSRILDRLGRMLDAFHAMNVAIRKNLQYTPGEAAVLRYTRPERAALSARISHLFTVLASSIKLEYPLNDVLPNIEHTRDHLLAKIAEYRRTNEARELTTEQDYEMLYAYVLVTGQLALDIEAVGNEIENLFGLLNEENLKLE